MTLVEAIKKARRVYIIGNGGSAANASHIANDLVLSCGIKAHALTADAAILTAIGNDMGYEYVFARQLEVYGEPGDLLIALSGSGNSPNIIKALLAASKIGMDTYSIVGDFGRSAAPALSVSCISTGTSMQDAENLQLHIGHGAMVALRSAP